MLVELLHKIYTHYRTQVTKYREYFPKNTPKGALETTIFMLRIIHKNPIYREAHPELSESFREDLRRAMTEACLSRYETLLAFNAPLDEQQLECVLESLRKLAEAISGEIDADAKYFTKAFSR